MTSMRQLLGELADQVGLSVRAEVVDQLVGEAGDVAADAAAVEAAPWRR